MPLVEKNSLFLTSVSWIEPLIPGTSITPLNCYPRAPNQNAFKIMTIRMPSGRLYFIVNHLCKPTISMPIYDSHLLSTSLRERGLTSSAATRVTSRDDWSFLREMIPAAIPLSVAREKRVQKETATAASPTSSTQLLSAQERLKIKVKRPVAPLPSRSSNGATSVIPPHLHVPNPQPTYSLREARAASIQHVPQQQPPTHPMPGFPNGVPYYPTPLVPPTGPQSATPDSAYPNGVRWAPGPPPQIVAQPSSSPQGGRRSSRQHARQAVSNPNSESQSDPQSQNQVHPSAYNPAMDSMMHPYMPPPGFYYPSPPGFTVPPPGVFVPHPGFSSHPLVPVGSAPGRSMTEKPGAAGGTGPKTQSAPDNDSHIIDPSLME
jgi:hypothetical protein